MNKERKINPPILKHIYRYFCVYSQNGKVILTYEDGGYYLGGRLPYNTDLLKVEQLDDLAAQRVLRVVKSLKFNKEKYEKSEK